ncbi:MAG TPA: general secretion pathway protein GspH [Cyanobacteria bacterium UBA11369]|nr:general secretion pathway protein GspH [Cyanobacteria bacterium UBA11371]HBE35255.1 general secretion pathway protein GspH [Cyanobacteria bacterium UBA11368]HBE51064.1 general secretion pathway protein GspH [Cyanobacteria bacterium UBA11369]
MNSVPQESKNNGCSGCLITLLCFFSVVGILGWIALPSFFSNQQAKPRQPEAKQYLSSINKGQQYWYTENGIFTHNFEALGVGIKTQTINYSYSISATKTAAFSYAISRDQKLKSYVGAVFLVPDPGGAIDDMTTVSIVCEAKSKGTTRIQDPILQNGVPSCGADSEKAR